MLQNINGFKYKELFIDHLTTGTKPEEFIFLGEGAKDKTVLDLCSGTGSIATLAAQQGATKVIAVEALPEMFVLPKKNIALYTLPVETALDTIQDTVNLALCRQGVNFWLSNVTAQKLARMMTVGSYFIFNTFNKKPSAVPIYKEYNIDGHIFIELVYAIDETVYHTQARDGIAPYHSQFMYISCYKYRTILEPYFDVTEIVRGKSSTYCCRKK